MARFNVPPTGAAAPQGSVANLLSVVVKAIEINDLTESLVALVEIAPAFACRTCRGRRGDPRPLPVGLRGDLEDALLGYLGAADYLRGSLTDDMVDLFSVKQLEEIIGELDGPIAHMRAALDPVVIAVEAATAMGLGRQLNEAVAEGWVGRLSSDVPCTCRGRALSCH